MPVNKFRDGIVFMKLKHASVFILAIVLIGFVSIYLTNTQKDVQEARRGHTASIGFTDGHSYEIASRGHTS
ncbi:aspartate phosphatase [Bacillus mojavensis]